MDEAKKRERERERERERKRELKPENVNLEKKVVVRMEKKP